MAYGNWGAFVYRHNERMYDWEDATPYKENEFLSGYIQAFQRDKGRNPHHAVLGENDIRLCGYKSIPVLFVKGEEIDLEPYKTTDNDSFEDNDYEGEINGCRFKVHQYEDNMVDLELLERDGTLWKSRCGYGIGAGH